MEIGNSEISGPNSNIIKYNTNGALMLLNNSLYMYVHVHSPLAN